MEFDRRQELRKGVLQGLAWVLVACVFLLLANVARPAEAADVAVVVSELFDRSGLLFPYYEAPDVLNSAAMHHHNRLASRLLTQLQSLNTLTTQYCAGGAALAALKEQYSLAYLTWLELSAVVTGPMLSNNTVRQIDFRPLRVNLLERAIQKQPMGTEQMALVGSPAKGFPAYEYLLAQPSFKPATAPCAYAREVVQDLARVVSELKWTSVENMAGDEDEQANALRADMQLYFNQLVGAVHNLAWERMEKSMFKASDQGAAGKGAVPPFFALNLTTRAWAAQWQGIEPLLVLGSPKVPDAVQQVIPLEAYLRGLGQIGLADKLVKQSAAAAVAMQANSLEKPEQIAQSIQALKSLKTFLEQDVAKGLNVSIQFSSSDGD